MARFISFAILFVLAVVSLTGAVNARSVASSLRSPDSVATNRVVAKASLPSKEAVLSNSLGSLSDNVIAQSSQIPGPLSKHMAALKMVFLFLLWYFFSAAYNVYNAYMKKDFKYPWATASWQLLAGLFYAVPLWFLNIRKMPKLTVEDLKCLLPIVLLNASGHAMTVAAMFEKGGGSFTHVIKASEPVVSAILNLLVNKIIPKPLTGISLLPVTYGVAYASTLGNLSPSVMGKELTTKAAKLAMGSNVAFAMRSILRKNLPADFQSRTNLDPANEHAMTTLLSFLLLTPFVLCFSNFSAMSSALSAIPNRSSFYFNSIVCGLTYYLYNEMQNKVLGSLGAVPTAVGNTLKRVVIFVGLYFFTAGEIFPWPKVLGCAIAILGCLSFAICESKKI
eukprot:CAMPEP_0174963962 /NCGR_PEP_ID=MMETSP0004_2-20121128/5618_1 /TAXON_ID=420556 /ORGANISM="Ochromonas sp., Strain CCMP1393" /LENGTH=392 /DNA_ID=CAMNT_0016212639 /DNA_START=26 /DNA_END=1204 /DNA_ORIENTATION=+